MTSTGFESRFIRARDGLKLHVRDYAPARLASTLPVVCLHGLARTSADFHTLALALAAHDKAPRRVVSLDYRGRGLSDRDPTWANYDIKVELDDLLQVLAAVGIGEAVFVGTSRGGLLTMAMAPVRPAAIRGVVLNDIGPIIDAQGLIRIRSYVGKMPSPRSWDEAAEIMRTVMGGQFPGLDDAGWRGYAERTWRQGEDGRFQPLADPALARTLEQLDLEAPPPVLWPLFEALKHAPMLAIRGERSDLLSAETLNAMAERHPACELHTVRGEGHAPLLESGDIIARIARLCRRADDAAGLG
jgi:pimeloyl-ACP methyl ester carboxylesterase